MLLALAFATLAALATAAPTYYPDTTTTTETTPYAHPDPAHPWTPAYAAGCDASTLAVHPGYAYPAYPYAELAVPEGQKLKYATVGRGVQEYTCTGGVYVGSGAKAE